MTNIRDLREALDKLPDTLDQYYEDEWARIMSQNQHSQLVARHTLSWLYLARRQLKVAELCDALAVRSGDKTSDPDGRIPIDEITEACQGLAVVEEHSQIVRLVHSTTLEYFQRQHDRLFKEAPDYRTKTCLTCLCFEEFDGTVEDIGEIEAAVDCLKKSKYPLHKELLSCFWDRCNPFVHYAAEYWACHARGDPETTCQDSILTFLQSDTLLYNAHIYHPQISSVYKGYYCKGRPEDLFPIRVAISFHLEITACHLVKSCFSLRKDIPRVREQWFLAFIDAIETR